MNEYRERDLRIRGLAAGLIYSLFMFLAFPPIGLWGFAIIAPVPLVLVMHMRAKRFGVIGVMAGLGTLPLWAFEHHWIMRVSTLGYFPFLGFSALWTWLLVWLGGSVSRGWSGGARLVWVVLIWVGLDYIRGAVFGGGYPWYFVSQPLIDAPGGAALASVLGQYGVTALVIVVIGAGVLGAEGKSRKLASRTLLGALVTLGVVIWTGVLTQPSPSGRAVHIAVVQTNVSSDNKVGWTPTAQLRDFDVFAELTRRAAVEGPDLIVWPETMLPGDASDPESVAASADMSVTYKDEDGVERQLPLTYFARAVEQLQREIGIPMLVGAKAADGLAFDTSGEGVRVTHDGLFNSALVVTDGRVQTQRYDKVHLTPFGETMPFISAWPWLESKLLALGANGMLFDLAAGDRIRVLELDLGEAGRVRIGTPICFESTVSGISRAMTAGGERARAGMLINLTNDGWFGESDAARGQHLLLARWRAAEVGRPLIRAANTGISAFIGPQGEVVARGVEGDARGERVEGVLSGRIPPVGGVTIFGRVGDVVGLGSAIGFVLVLLVAAIRKKKRVSSPTRLSAT